MGISEAQLETWAKQGSVTGSSKTYNLVKDTLEDGAAPYDGKDYTVFLQGSYGNTTNIYAESDVDLVIVLNESWQKDLSELNDDQKAAYDKSFGIATYDHAAFKKDVLTVLRNEYGDDVEDGNKALYVPPSTARRSADVVVAIQYRRYFKFNGVQDQSYEEGICFYDKAGTLIANYPKQHSANMTTRHQASSGWLKPMVRIIKNARTKLVEGEAIEAGVAPSYYLEGLMFNMPLDKYANTFSDTLYNFLKWMEDTEDKSKWVCANKQYYLLREGSHTCWPSANFKTFQNALVELWNNWQ